MADIANPSVGVVLVHGGFVDGSGWEGVYDILKKDNYNVARYCQVNARRRNQSAPSGILR